jgi:hypothetical protein
MGCTNATILTGVAFDCDDIPTGGLKTIYLVHKADITTYTVVAGAMTSATIALTKVVQLEFNNKDAFTSFTDVKTVTPAGIVSAVPTIVVEFPKMTVAKRNELTALTQSAGTELVAFVETAAGTKHVVGLDFGLYASTVNGQSGTGRSDKNIFQLTLTGEESELSYGADAVWEEVLVALA